MSTRSVNAALKNFLFWYEEDIIVDSVGIYSVLNVLIILLMAIILGKLRRNISGIVSSVIRKYKNLLDNGLKCLKYISRKMHRRAVLNSSLVKMTKTKNK